MLGREERRVIEDIFEELKDGAYSRRECDAAHDGSHIERVLKMQEAFWPELNEEQPEVEAFSLSLAILFHDLNRSKGFRKDGRREEQFMRETMQKHGIPTRIQNEVIETINLIRSPDGSDETPIATLLRDLDKADMGAIGVLRIAALIEPRGYEFYRKEDFDPQAQPTEGDENLGSAVDDIKFCLEWWSNPRWQIKSRALREKVEQRFLFMLEFLGQLEKELLEIGVI